MLNPDYRKLLKGKSRYSLVTAVAKRARDITNDTVLREKCGDDKAVSMALEEFVSGKLKIINPEDVDTLPADYIKAMNGDDEEDEAKEADFEDSSEAAEG